MTLHPRPASHRRSTTLLPLRAALPFGMMLLLSMVSLDADVRTCVVNRLLVGATAGRATVDAMSTIPEHTEKNLHLTENQMLMMDDDIGEPSRDCLKKRDDDDDA